MSGEQILPNNVDAELTLLSALVQNPATLANFPPGDPGFYRASHSKILDAARQVQSRGIPLDDFSLCEELRKKGDLEQVGGPAYISAIFDRLGIPGHVPWCLDEIREKAAARKALPRVERLLREIWRFNGDGAGSILAALEEAHAAIKDMGSSGETNPRLHALSSRDYDPDEKAPVEFGHAGGEALLTRGDLILITGEVGTCKSILTLEASRARSRGKPLLGFPCDGPGKALCLNSDGEGNGPVRKRLARLFLGADGKVSDIDAPELRVFAPDSFCLDFPADMAALMAFLKEHDPDLLALDSLNSLMRPDREAYSAAGIGDFLRTAIRPLQIRPDGSRRTTLVVHHLRKRQAGPGGNSLKDRISGSYYTLGGVDAAIGLEATGPETFSIRMVKRSRWGTSFEPFLARIEGKPDEPLRLVSLGHLKPSKAELGEDENTLLESMSAIAALLGPEAWIPLADAKARQGITRDDATRSKRMDRAADRLEEAERLERHPNGKRLYRLLAIPQAEPQESE